MKRTLLALALLALVLPAAALAGNGGLAPPDSASPSGHAIKVVYWVVFTVCAVVFVLVESALILFVLRFRRRRETPADAEGPQIHGNTRLEIIWTIVPTVILAGIAAFTFAKVPDVQATPDASDNPLTVRVESHQFYWQYVYPNGAISLDTLRLPVDRPVTLELVSFDVNHSWWVPEITGKLDAIPGRTNELSFEPTELGTFENGQCAEFCGVQHAIMETTVEVISNDEFDSWVESKATDQASPEFGEETFQAACAKCHGPEGEGGVGPRIQGNPLLTTPDGLFELIENGRDDATFEGYMPPVARGWPEFQKQALLEYLEQSLAARGGGSGDTS